MSKPHVYNIHEEITQSSVQNVICVLESASSTDCVLLILASNHGGDVNAAIRLIEAIKSTQAHVIIKVESYAISAAAFIYLWFWVYSESHVETPPPDESAILIYHRPRISFGEHLAFISDLKQGMPEWDALNTLTQLFDELFERFFIELCDTESTDALLYGECRLKHQLQHAKDGYYANQDFTIPL